MGKFEPQQFRDELVVEQEKKIPELFVYEKAPVLQLEAIKVLREQWEKFWELRFAKHEGVVPEEAAQNLALLKNGTLLHNLSYDEATLSKILQSGILSGELGYGEKQTVAEDSETNYCADFFINHPNETKFLRIIRLKDSDVLTDWEGSNGIWA